MILKKWNTNIMKFNIRSALFFRKKKYAFRKGIKEKKNTKYESFQEPQEGVKLFRYWCKNFSRWMLNKLMLDRVLRQLIKPEQNFPDSGHFSVNVFKENHTELLLSGISFWIKKVQSHNFACFFSYEFPNKYVWVKYL